MKKERWQNKRNEGSSRGDTTTIKKKGKQTARYGTQMIRSEKYARQGFFESNKLQTGYKGGIADSAKKAHTTLCAAEDRTHACDVNGVNLPLKPTQFNSNPEITFYHDTEHKKNDVLQACLRAFQKKKDELCQQQRLLEDDIARCEMNIQIILSEGEETWTRKVELIIEALNNSCSSEVQMNPSPEEQSPLQTSKRKRLSEAVLTSRN